jgi:insecticidal toxin complex protein TccC
MVRVCCQSPLFAWCERLKDNAQTMHQTRYQLNSHLQSNTLELDDQAQTLSYEHYYPYGGTAIIAGKDITVRTRLPW